MKSIERRFNNIFKKNPYWSSYICFTEAIKGQDFGKQAMAYWFNKLVDKDDYDKSDKKALLSFLDGLTNNAEEHRK